MGNGGVFEFLGDVVFTWIPSVLTTIITIGTGQGSEPTQNSPEIGPPTEPLTAPDFPGFLEMASAPGVYDSIVSGWHGFVLLSIAFSLPFLAVVIYCWIRIFLLREHEARVFEAAAREPAAAPMTSRTHVRWQRILEQAGSDDSHDWRLAILEADIMLNELLDMKGYKGETMAEKMKQADRADFNSIDAAWEAHKIRNDIVHRSATYSLSQRETQRVIGLYERVFEEFGYIE